jgi:hypothetical protein
MTLKKTPLILAAGLMAVSISACNKKPADTTAADNSAAAADATATTTADSGAMVPAPDGVGSGAMAGDSGAMTSDTTSSGAMTR